MADSRAVVGGLNIGQGKQVSTEGSSAGSMFRPSSSILPKGGRTNPGIEEKDLEASENKWPILVCLLGDFCILKGNYPLMLHGDKTATLVQLLALRKGKIVSREALLDTLWPGRTTALAGQSLNSLIYSLRKTVEGSVLEGGLILQQGVAYRLNTSAGVGVDIALFDNLVQSGHQARAAGEISFSNTCFIQAIRLYRGDLRIGSALEVARALRNDQNHPALRLAEALVKLHGHQQQGGQFMKALDSSLMPNRPNGIAFKRRVSRSEAGTRKAVDLRSIVLSNALLDFLVHRHLRKDGEGKSARPLTLPRFLDILRDRYGLHVDREPPGMSVPQDLLRANKQWLERRLRDLGLLVGVNDAESMKQLRARFDVA